MKTIQVDDEVYAALGGRAQGFHVTPNDVLRSVLGLGAKEISPPNTDALLKFLSSPQFQRAQTDEQKYLSILSWLITEHADFAPDLDGFSLRKRVYIAKDAAKIRDSSRGAIFAKPIPGTSYFALVTLDNKGKRRVLSTLLERVGVPQHAIISCTAMLPDGIGKRVSKSQPKILKVNTPET